MSAPTAPVTPRTIYRCCDDRRREAVRAHGTLNGIDFLEVDDGPGVALADRQRTLFVHFLKPLAPGALATGNVRIDGGERITAVGVVSATIGAGADADILSVGVDAPGDFSPYTLSLVVAPGGSTPPAGFDPVLSSVDFSFKVACPSDLDCAPRPTCAPAADQIPELDYLSKDYNGFRRLLLDRLAVLAPQWAERNPADLGVALVELLAYVGDQLSYQQDAVATEAYLGTARRRISARRHARLVDYHMHDGCNARAWVQILVAADGVVVAPGTQLLSRLEGVATRLPPASGPYQRALALDPVVFETMAPAITCFTAHQEMKFYAWGARDCCLPTGATRATLLTHLPNLNAGDVLVFEEMRGPHTGQPGDADPAHRHAVRLTQVALTSDPAGGRFPDPATGTDAPVDVTSIEWDADDALPFPVCISSVQGTAEWPDVSVARGNIVLADHGRTLTGESLGTVPEPILYRPSDPSGDRCVTSDPVPLPPRYTPRFARAPLSQVAPYDPGNPGSAAAVMRFEANRAVAGVSAIHGTFGGSSTPWTPRRDLLGSRPEANDIVIEVDDDGVAAVRFGDSRHGARPASGTVFVADYRIGNGIAGNLGAESLHHIVSGDAAVLGVRNPLPARGGQDPESIPDVRARAPAAFRTQERAVTEADYGTAAERLPGIQRAAATFRWTGSWRTVFVSVDRLCGTPVDEPFRETLLGALEPSRMAGYDLDVDVPRPVSVELELQVCVLPDYLRANVKEALLDVFSNRVLADGRRGFFHPDNWTFHQPLYISAIYAAAQAVPGVGSLAVTTLQRQGNAGTQALDAGYLSVGRLEIIRLDNDPSWPEHGLLRLRLDGGR